MISIQDQLNMEIWLLHISEIGTKKITMHRQDPSQSIQLEEMI